MQQQKQGQLRVYVYVLMYCLHVQLYSLAMPLMDAVQQACWPVLSDTGFVADGLVRSFV